MIEPPAAGGDLAAVRGLVQAALAAGLVLEVLHGVGHVGLAPLDPSLGQGPVQHPAGRTDEGLARQVLLVARLLADEHHRGVGRPLARNTLGGVGPEVAAAAVLDRLGDRGEGARLRCAAFLAVCRGQIAHPPPTLDAAVRLPLTGDAD